MAENAERCCPVCESKDVLLFHGKVCHWEQGKVYRCNKCDVTFLFPMLSEGQERELYCNYNEYVAKRWGKPATTAKDFHKARMATVTWRHKQVARFFTSSKAVLEIGSATGGFLGLLTGYECYGVESSDENREFSKQFAQEVWTDIADIPDTKQFDSICMFHVFEHIRNPNIFIEACKKHLVKGGQIILEVPCIEDPLISLYNLRAYKDFYFQPIHPYVYSEGSLNYVFSHAGMKTKEVFYAQHYSLDNHLAWLITGRPGGDAVFAELFENNTQYCEKLCERKIADTIFFVAQKQ